MDDCQSKFTEGGTGGRGIQREEKKGEEGRKEVKLARRKTMYVPGRSKQAIQRGGWGKELRRRRREERGAFAIVQLCGAPANEVVTNAI